MKSSPKVHGRTLLMIGIDTNALVRFPTRDDPAQFELVEKLLVTCTLTNAAFLSRKVMIETIWVLERPYKFERNTIASALDGLLVTPSGVVEAATHICLALHYTAPLRRPKFCGSLIEITAHAQGYDTIFTFDKQAASTP